MNVHAAQNSFSCKEKELISISSQFLLAVKTNQATELYTDILAETTESDLGKQLYSDDLKKAFWINIYNACTQMRLLQEPVKYKRLTRLFSVKQVVIAGVSISLDDIEHGLLRRSKIKWGLGYLNKPFPSGFEKANRVDKIDYRIHFALNCGAKSCPAIAFYNPAQIDTQLDLATEAYLREEALYHPKENAVTLPAIMGWYRGDFYGKKGMLAILNDLSIIPAGKSPVIKFKKYNWNLYLENYKT